MKQVIYIFTTLLLVSHSYAENTAPLWVGGFAGLVGYGNDASVATGAQAATTRVPVENLDDAFAKINDMNLTKARVTISSTGAPTSRQPLGPVASETFDIQSKTQLKNLMTRLQGSGQSVNSIAIQDTSARGLQISGQAERSARFSRAGKYGVIAAAIAFVILPRGAKAGEVATEETQLKEVQVEVAH